MQRAFPAEPACWLEAKDVQLHPKGPDEGLGWGLTDIGAEEKVFEVRYRSLEKEKGQQLLDKLFQQLDTVYFKFERLPPAESRWPSYTIVNAYEEQIRTSTRHPGDWTCDSSCYGLFADLRRFAEEAATEAVDDDRRGAAVKAANP
jgi:hypothetical protein